MRTVDGTAKAGEDYEEKNELFTMHKEEKEREIKIGIMDDPDWEPDEEFKVQLLDELSMKLIDGDDTECTVLIQDEDKPGSIAFAETQVDFRRKDHIGYIMIERKDGSDGEISCIVNTISNVDKVPGKKPAVENKDFTPIKMKKIIFKSGEVQHKLEIEMPDCVGEEDDNVEPEEADTVSFAIQLSQPQPNGVKLSKKSTCFVNIEATDTAADEAADLERKKMLEFFCSNIELTWGQQFKVACMLGPQIDQDNLHVEEVGCGAAVWHFLSLFWKVVGAIVPPRKVWGGWASFLVALFLTGVVTTIVGEVATVLGCVINLKPAVTGITIVAMGTSLPDTFASKTAAQSSPNADSAIGNVTGSNSVNVFLGMGLPWVIATIYWRVEAASDYAVPPGSMSFSVIMFISCSMVCFLILGLRRCCLGGELGGEGCTRNFSAVILFCLWLIYVVFVALESYEIITVEIGDVPPPPDL